MRYWFLARFLVPRAIKSFCRTNMSRWREFLGGKDLLEGSILVDGMQKHPAHLIRMGITSNALKKIKGLKTMWVTNKSNRTARCVINSYGADRTKTMRIFLFTLALLRSLIEAASVFLSLKEAGDALKITYRGVLIGDLIYDNYVRETGLGTILKKDFCLFRKITEGLFMYRWYERLIKKHNVKYIVLMHVVYNLSGVLLRVGIKHNAVAYGCMGMGDQLSVMKYGSFDDVGRYQRNILPDLFDDIFKNRLAMAKRQMDGYFAERLSGRTSGNPIIGYAYGGDKRVYTKAELAGLLGLDPGKPWWRGFPRG